LPVDLADISGNSYIGVFCRLTGGRLLAPLEASDQFVEMAARTLGVEVIKTMLGGTNLHGSLIASNTKGIMAPYFFDLDEITSALTVDGEPSSLSIDLSDDPHTAWGNNVLLAETIALVNPDLSPGTVSHVADVFDVEVVPMTIAGIKTVGSVAILNSKGVVVHPKTAPDEIERLKEIFKRDVSISTVNFGSPYLGSSIIANDRGALIGARSSGVEINRIENTLDIIL
jgi:translation initiation factor 6